MGDTWSINNLKPPVQNGDKGSFLMLCAFITNFERLPLASSITTLICSEEDLQI